MMVLILVAVAWAYVTLMMAVAEATSPAGSVLGALFTLLLYGVLPVALILYIGLTPARKRALRARSAIESGPGTADAEQATEAQKPPPAGTGQP
jgi:hypothetical protein